MSLSCEENGEEKKKRERKLGLIYLRGFLVFTRRSLVPEHEAIGFSEEFHASKGYPL